ncbi:MAG: hypothetical protein OEU51_10415 [Gammaproteobacteria bacterium]|nr:hypothetical protein [Gammaproteobacteria bacterium]
MHHSHPLKTLNKLVFYASLILLLTSCWQRNDFPEDMSVTPALLKPPVQSAVSTQAFTVANNGTDYRIEPRYQYDLHGLVVSYAHHNGNYSLHRLWNDHINVADVCVVWSGNTNGADLNDFKFWNGKFTCNFQTGDAGAWERFREDQISNNHLLTDNSRIRKHIKQVRIGDQIRIRGWLVNYSNDDGFSRGTSTTRDDTGNGACETIYLKQFEILQPLDNGWRTLMSLALAGVIGSSLVWLVAVMRGRF